MAGRPKSRARKELQAQGLPLPAELAPCFTPAFSAEDGSAREAALKSAEVRALKKEMRRKTKEAGEQGYRQALEHLAPQIAEQDVQIQQMGTHLLTAAEKAIEAGDIAALQEINGPLKTFLTERQNFMNRLYGSATQRSQNQNLNLNASVELTDLPHLKGNA